MTDTALDPNDTGEIKRLASLGDDPTRNLAKFVMSAPTEVLAYADLVNAARRPDATGELPVITVAPGPDSFLPPGQPKPPPLPSPPKPTGLIVEWEFTPETEPDHYVGRHRDPFGRRAPWLLTLFRQVYRTLRGAM